MLLNVAPFEFAFILDFHLLLGQLFQLSHGDNYLPTRGWRALSVRAVTVKFIAVTRISVANVSILD